MSGYHVIDLPGAPSGSRIRAFAKRGEASAEEASELEELYKREDVARFYRSSMGFASYRRDFFTFPTAKCWRNPTPGFITRWEPFSGDFMPGRRYHWLSIDYAALFVRVIWTSQTLFDPDGRQTQDHRIFCRLRRPLMKTYWNLR
jgi:hypothetical protein